ncbi:MAG: 2'-5' RNA ligase family protein [Chloroflexota bacterium]
MHGLVSLLDTEHNAKVESLWYALRDECGLKDFYVTPLPHFSWQVAEDYDWDELEGLLQSIAAEVKPFTIHTGGLALFTGANPVIYTPVVRTAELSRIHQMIWERLAPVSVGACPCYAPSFWMPHISLAYNDVTPETLNCILNRLAFQTYNWAIEVDNITLIYEPGGTLGTVKYQFDFGGKDSAS